MRYMHAGNGDATRANLRRQARELSRACLHTYECTHTHTHTSCRIHRYIRIYITYLRIYIHKRGNAKADTRAVARLPADRHVLQGGSLSVAVVLYMCPLYTQGTYIGSSPLYTEDTHIDGLSNSTLCVLSIKVRGASATSTDSLKAHHPKGVDPSLLPVRFRSALCSIRICATCTLFMLHAQMSVSMCTFVLGRRQYLYLCTSNASESPCVR